MRPAAAGTAALRFDGLARALLASLPGCLLPWLFAKFLRASFEAADELPALTATWLALYPLAFLLPVLVYVAWRALAGRPGRDRIALAIGAGGSVLVDAVSIIAVWVAVVRLPGGV